MLAKRKHLLFVVFLACSISVPYLRAQSFSNPLRLSTPTSPVALAVGDLTGNGIPDIVWSDGSTFHVLLQSRTGIYNAAPDLVPPADTSPACAIADFNKDGRGDLVCPTSTGIEVFPGNGDGTFLPPILTQLSSMSTYPPPLFGAPADLNGDGFPDVIVEYSGTAAVLLSDGQGSFRAAIPLTPGTGLPIVLDLNGDGKPDLFFPSGPSVAIGNGDGTFQPIVNYASSSYPGATCMLHDMDRDGHVDAVCGYYETAGATDLVVLHGYPNGSFNTTPLAQMRFGDGDTSTDGLGSFQYPIAVEDVNGDGTPDVLAYSSDGLAVLLGGPNLTFTAPVHYADAVPAPGQTVPLFPFQAQVVDIDGNGTPDVVSIGPIGIYLTRGQPNGTFASALAPEVAESVAQVTVADFNGDGIPDIVADGDTALKLSLGKGDGTFASPTPLPSGNGVAIFNGAMDHGDFDGRGFEDAVFAGTVGAGPSAVQNTYLQFGNGDGTFSPVDKAEVPGSSIVWNLPGYTFTGSPIVDINKDGKADFVAMQNLPPEFAILSDLSNGDGTFREVSTQVPYYYMPFDPFTYEYPSPPPVYHLNNSALAMADFNEDGVLDAAYGSLADLVLMLGKGDGSFYQRMAPTLVPNNGMLGVNVQSVAAGDFDADGHQDIAALIDYYYSPARDDEPKGSLTIVTEAWVFYGNGDGTFSAPVLAATFDQLAPNTYRNVVAPVLGKDGRADLVFYTQQSTGPNSAVGVVLSQPSRTFSPVATYSTGQSLANLVIADLNGDGLKDLVAANDQLNPDQTPQPGSSATILLNQGLPQAVTGLLTSSPEPSAAGQPITLSVNLTPPAGSASLGGTVTFAANGVAVGTASVKGNSVSISGPTNLPSGFNLLTATWSGDATHSEIGLSAFHTINQLPVSVVITGNPAGTSEPGQVITFNVTVTPVDPKGEAFSTNPFLGTLMLYDVTTVGSVQNASLIGTQTNPAGTYSFDYGATLDEQHIITAVYSGDSFYAPGEGIYLQNVAILATSIKFTANPSTVQAGLGVTLTAKLSAMSTCTTCPFTEPVKFSDAGTVLGSAVPDASGVATLAAVLATGGERTLLAGYPGDSDHQPGAALLVEEVLPANASLRLTASANTAPRGTPVVFTAQIVPVAGTPNLAGAPIAFSVGSNVFDTVATDVNGTAVASSATLPAGVDKITATLAQTPTFNPASTSVDVTITKAPATITLSASPNPVYQRSLLTLGATITTPPGFQATGTVQLLDGAIPLGTPAIANNAATIDLRLLTVGPHTITAVYAGDANTLPATSAPLVVTVLLSNFALSSTPDALTVQTQHHLTFTLAARGIGNFADELLFSADLLPAHMSLRFDPTASLALPEGGNSTISVYLDTDDVLGYAKFAPGERPGTHPPTALWAFLPAPFLLLFLARRRRGWAAVAIVLLAGLLIPLSGCSGLYPKSTAPGTYTIQIHAVGAQTAVAQTLNLQVTVTQ